MVENKTACQVVPAGHVAVIKLKPGAGAELMPLKEYHVSGKSAHNSSRVTRVDLPFLQPFAIFTAFVNLTTHVYRVVKLLFLQPSKILPTIFSDAVRSTSPTLNYRGTQSEKLVVCRGIHRRAGPRP